MDLQEVINDFSFRLTLNELKLLNKRKYDGDISYNSIMYLEIISYLEKCTISRLANLLEISKSAVTIKINELEKQGFIKKVQSTVDKRVYYIKLCADLDKINKSYDRRFNDAVEQINSTFSKDKIDAFCEVLEVFTQAVTKETDNE